MDHQHRRSNDATVPSPLSDSHRHADMGSIYSSVPPQPKKATTSLNDLQDDLLLNVLQHLSVRDVEAVAIASKHVAHGVIPKFPVWKSLFCHRWTSLNFPLRTHGTTGVVPIDIDPRLRALFPPECSESRMYQLLTHAVTPVPSYVDVRETERARFFSTLDHAIEAVGDPPRRQTLDVAYAGRMLGGDRCVRSNTPFAPMFRVQVYAIHADASRKTIKYRVGVVASGYFEISIRDPPRRRSVMMTRSYGDDVTSIGLGDRSFPLTTKQPGWDGHSIGYHGDDGNLFKRSTRGRPFAVPFGVGDTVGCGVRHDFDSPTSSSFAYFTNNGDLIPTGDRMIELPQNEWYPVVGLDSLNVIHFNFGQEPFVCTAAVDALFRECEGQQAILATQLQWYNISDSDCESDSDSVSSLGRSSESDSDLSGGEFERMYDHVPEFSAFINELISDMMDDESEASVEGSTDVSPDDEAFSP